MVKQTVRKASVGLTASSPQTEYSVEFIQGMLDRMGVSFHKYGAVKDAYPHKIDALDSMRKRVKRYRETGNKEWLIDAANFLMIEFLLPSQEATFRSTSSDESPGRTTVCGEISRGHNLEV